MNDNNGKYNPVMAALIGGLAGGLIVYLSSKERREGVIHKFEEVFAEGEEKGLKFKDKIDKTINTGRNNLAKKIREVEKKVAKS